MKILQTSLKLKFIFFTCLILLFISLLLISFLFLYLKSTFYSLQNERGLSLVRCLAALNREPLKAGKNLDLRVADVVMENDVEDALIFDREDEIAAPLKSVGESAKNPLLIKALQQRNPEPFTQIDKRRGKEKFIISLPLFEGEEKIGTAVVDLSLGNINKLLRRLFARVLLLTVFVLLIGGWGGFFLIKFILKSITDFQDDVEVVGTSDKFSQVEIPREKELAKLGAAINRMIKRIETRIRHEKKD